MVLRKTLRGLNGRCEIRIELGRIEDKAMKESEVKN